jgi:hypothetical protein
MLAQHALGFDISGHNFHIKEKPMQKEENKLSHAQIFSIEIRADLGDWRNSYYLLSM